MKDQSYLVRVELPVLDIEEIFSLGEFTHIYPTYYQFDIILSNLVVQQILLHAVRNNVVKLDKTLSAKQGPGRKVKVNATNKER